MSDPQTDEQPEVTGDGVFHPEAAQYQPYNEAMAAWRNQVAAMTSPAVPGELQEEPGEPEREEETQETPEEAPEAAETPQDVEPEQTEEDGPFNPSEHNAPVVLDYLRTADYNEALRVLDAEEAGKGRKGITNARADILGQAKASDPVTE